MTNKKEKLIFYQDKRIKKHWILLNLSYEELFKKHSNITTDKHKIESVLLSQKNILYILDKKGNVLEELKQENNQ